MTTRRSLIWKSAYEEFKNLFDGCFTQTGILEQIGLRANGSNYARLQERIKEEGLDIEELNKRKKQYRKKQLAVARKKRKGKPDCEVFLSGKKQDNDFIKHRMVKSGIENKCSVCGLPGEWNGQPLTLQLDHINGDNKDYELKNLRLLCPNCHSQTDNFCGKNVNKCIECEVTISHGAVRCVECANLRKRRAVRPGKEALLQQVKELGYCGTARLYGVSDNAIRKWLKG